MTYLELKNKIEAGEIELHFRAEKEFKNMAADTDETAVDRFIRWNHIKVVEMPEDQKAWIEYNSLYRRLCTLAIGTKFDGDFFALSNDMLTGKAYGLTEGEKKEMMTLEARLAELKPLASKWAKFTNSKLQEWNNWF